MKRIITRLKFLFICLALLEILHPLRTFATANRAPSISRGRGRSFGDEQQVPGQSRTLLPDGRWLLTGGERSGGMSDEISIWDPNTNFSTKLSASLLEARAWHTATLLPDGTVLIVGGIDSSRTIVQTAEIFDPATQYCHFISIGNFVFRAHHTATVLSNGYVLFAGGIGSSGELVGGMQAWDSRSEVTEAIPTVMITPRQDQSASLNADGTVLFWGGLNANGLVINDGEVFDPLSQNERIETNPIALEPQTVLPFLAASIPLDNSTDFPVNGLISLRFSRPLAVQSINAHTITLAGPGGLVDAKVVPVDGGMLAFVTPSSPLSVVSSYTLVAHGPLDLAGKELPETQITFATAGIGGTAAINGGNADAGPPSDNWSKLPPLQAPKGVTALAGQALRLSGAPLPHVLLQIDGHGAFTDSTGRFLLENIAPGHHAMVIDGGPAGSGGRTYGIFLDGVDIQAGQTNVLDYTIWMTRINTQHAITIPSPTATEAVITSPLMPGFELRIPPNTIIKDLHGKVVTQISITPIPVRQPPFPLPLNVQVPVYFTIQPGGAYLVMPANSWAHGARLFYPNFRHAAPGTPFDFWNYDAYGKGWYVYGQGRINAAGSQIVPDPGVEIYEFTGAMATSRLHGGTGPNGGGSDGEPVDLYTGLFIYNKTDLYLPDTLPIILKRSYHQSDLTSYAFGIGTNHIYDMFLEGDSNPYTYLDLVLPDGTVIAYGRISSGTGYTNAVYENTTSPTGFLASQISWNGTGWTLRLKNGTSLFFPDSYQTTRPQQAALLGIQDRFGNKLQCIRDSNSNLIEVISPNGRWVQFTYDSLYRVTQAQDILGRVVSYGYDGFGRLATATDANGGVTSYGYDSADDMTTITDPRGILYLTNQYDSNDRVSQQTLANGGIYHFSYDTSQTTGLVTQTNVTDPLGNIRQVSFNSDGYPVSDSRAVGKPENQLFIYSRQAGTDLPLNVTDPISRVTSFAYDSSWNLTSVTRLASSAAAATTSATYDPTFNQVTTVTDPLNHTVSYNYDSVGGLVQFVDALGNQTAFAHNLGGQTTSITDPLGNTTHFAYDAGDMMSVTDPLGRTVSAFRDVGGRLLSLKDPANSIATFNYDALDDLVTAKDPLGGITSFAYDPDGNLLSITDAKSHMTSFTYDPMDQMAMRTDPLQRTESYMYDLDGNLIRFADRRGKIATFMYDGINRTTFAGYGMQTGPIYESSIGYAYDGGNRLTQAIDSITGTISRMYDGLDNLKEETTPQGTVSYDYDAASRRTGMLAGNQTAISYSYDSGNHVTQIAQGNVAVSFSYDTLGRRTILSLPNGVTTDYGYDAASELSGITYSLNSITLGRLIYGYDVSGRRTSLSGSLASVALPLPVSPASYDGADELTQWGTATPTYDANGNTLSDGTNSFAWNARNQLGSMNAGADSFQYDGFGRRVSKTILATTTNYLYDGLNPAQELVGGTPTATLLMGGVDEYFQRTDSNGSASFLRDALGNTLALTDSNANLLAQYTYEPFGNTTVSGGSFSPYQYTGRENDVDGVYFYRSRYYNSALQRFVSEDPIGVAGGVNLYAYVVNDPVNYSDPLGLDKKSGTCPPPSSNFPKTIGVSAGVLAAGNRDGTTYTAGASLTDVVSLDRGAVGVLSNVGAQAIPSAAPPGAPQANGQYAGAGFQVMFSNGQPGQLLGPATSYQVSAGLLFVGGTVAYSRYPNGVYKLSFTPVPGIPGTASLGIFWKQNVPQTTYGLTTGCQL